MKAHPLFIQAKLQKVYHEVWTADRLAYSMNARDY